MGGGPWGLYPHAYHVQPSYVVLYRADGGSRLALFAPGANLRHPDAFTRFNFDDGHARNPTWMRATACMGMIIRGWLAKVMFQSELELGNMKRRTEYYVLAHAYYTPSRRGRLFMDSLYRRTCRHTG